METISNTTVTKCQHCGKWTNYAGDAHHKEREARIAELEALEALLYDGYEVYKHLPDKIAVTQRTGHENIGDTLDAMSRAWRAALAEREE